MTSRARRPGLRLVVEPDVHPDIRRDALELVRWLRRSQRIDHALVLTLFGAGAIGRRNDPPRRWERVGLCIFPHVRPDTPAGRAFLFPIWVATGHAYRVRERERCSWPQAIGNVLAILLHEFSHYEQWRDGRPNTERGRWVRAKGLLGQFRRAVPWTPYGHPPPSLPRR
jgi:hypothetical protein